MPRLTDQDVRTHIDLPRRNALSLKFAFIGFRHFHILGLYKLVKEHPDCELVAACEESEQGRSVLPDDVTITHTDYKQMLDEVDCDVVATGDYYGKRGSVLIEALKRGKHIIADKPVCTRLTELNEIEKLAREKNLTVGCQLDMINSPNLHVVKQLIDDGRLGDIHQIAIGGQHPLNYGSRPMWYFEQGKHGGTINDIAIHAIHALPLLTGHNIDQCVAARTWNAFATDQPHFPDSAQAMLTLDNGCGVMIDVSYAMPNSQGYTLPHYWRQTFYGSKGIAETSATMGHVWLAENGKDKPETIGVEGVKAEDFFDAYLADVAGNGRAPLTTADVIRASRQSLQIQQAADDSARDVKL
jgi:predicted dehydrogenase